MVLKSSHQEVIAARSWKIIDFGLFQHLKQKQAETEKVQEDFKLTFLTKHVFIPSVH